MPKIVNEHGFRYISFANGNGVLSLINDYQQLFGKWNWVIYHALHVYLEKDLMVGESYELSVAVLGLGFTLRYTAKLNPELQKTLDGITKITKNENNEPTQT